MVVKVDASQEEKKNPMKSQNLSDDLNCVEEVFLRVRAVVGN